MVTPIFSFVILLYWWYPEYCQTLGEVQHTELFQLHLKVKCSKKIYEKRLIVNTITGASKVRVEYSICCYLLIGYLYIKFFKD